MGGRGTRVRAIETENERGGGGGGEKKRMKRGRGNGGGERENERGEREERERRERGEREREINPIVCMNTLSATVAFKSRLHMLTNKQYLNYRVTIKKMLTYISMTDCEVLQRRCVLCVSRFPIQQGCKDSAPVHEKAE